MTIGAGAGVRFDRDYSPSRASSAGGYDHSGPVPGPLALTERPRSHSRSGREIRDEIRTLERELAYRPKGQVIESSGNRRSISTLFDTSRAGILVFPFLGYSLRIAVPPELDERLELTDERESLRLRWERVVCESRLLSRRRCLTNSLSWRRSR